MLAGKVNELKNLLAKFMNESHKWLLRKPGLCLIFTVEVRELLQAFLQEVSWDLLSRLTLGVAHDGISRASRVLQYLSLLGLTEAQKDPTGLFWDRQLSFWNNFFLVTFPLPSTLCLPQCQLWLSGNGDVCPVETSWDHIWILKHRYFLLCKVRPFFFPGNFQASDHK